MTDRNEKLIEDTAKAIYEAQVEEATCGDLARAALAVFEKAHTPKVIERHDLVMPIYEDEPTDDEVNAVALAYWGPSVTYDRERLRAALAGFRRSEVPEPSDPARITIEHEGGNTVTGTLDEVLNHGHLKPGWRYRRAEPQGEASDARFGSIVSEVITEAERSIAKHGEQGDLPMGTGPETYPLATDGPAMFDTLPAEDLAEIATADTKYHSRNEGGNDTCTWWHILREEVFEAAAESEPTALRKELVQVATVAVKMIDALDASGGVR